MNIYQVMEECHLDQAHVSDNIVRYVSERYTDEQWNDLIRIFLTGIAGQHVIPGDVIFTLQGISHWHQQQRPLTVRQRIYTAANIMTYWNYVGVGMRSNLPI